MHNKYKQKNLFLYISVYVLFIIFQNGLYAEQYQATIFTSRSLLFRNSYGLFYDDYESIILPRLSGYLNNNHLITNLSALNGPDSIELGYAGKFSFGTLTFLFNRSVYSQDSVNAVKRVETKDTDSDGLNDFIIETDEINSLTKEGVSQPYSNLNSYQLFFGLGKGFIDDSLHIGAGVGFGDRKHRRDYDADELGLTTKGIYGFSSSMLLEREHREIILFPDVITTRIRDEREDGILTDRESEVSLILGSDYILSENLTLYIDLLLGLRSKKSKGDAVYTYNESLNNHIVNAEMLGDFKDDSLNRNRLGLALGSEYRVAHNSSINIDIGFEASRGDIKKDTILEVYERTSTAPIGIWSMQNEEAQTTFIGDAEKYRLFIVNLRGKTEIIDDLLFGIGVEYAYYDNYNLSATTSTYYKMNDFFNDGDNEVNDKDDYEGNGYAFIAGKIRDRNINHIISIPAGIRYKISKKIELRFGARHSIKRTKNSYSKTFNQLNLYSYERKRANGVIEKSPDSPISGLPGRNSTFSPEIKASDVKMTNSTDLSFGVGFYASEHLVLNLLFSENLNSIYGDKLDITSMYLSCMIAF